MSYTGTWKAITKSPMGEQESTFELIEKDGVITGKGISVKETVEVTNGKANGPSATWDIAVTKPLKITLSHTVELHGDTIKGKVKLGVFGTADIVAMRT